MNRKSKVLVGTVLAAVTAPLFATQPNTAVLVPHSIPAVGQAGLIVMAFAVGIIGAVLIRKYKPHKH
ncbi:MAG: hypothetical protein HKN58_05385 [Xanthomonadales bacterium]|nr:hypothetical protein [Xanthomonadales bacterium]